MGFLRSVVRRTFQKRYILPSIARVTATTFIFTNIAFAHQPQTTLWNERKQETLQLASLPSNLPFAPHRSTLEQNLLKQIPTPAPVKATRASLPARFGRHADLALPQGVLTHLNIREVRRHPGSFTLLLIEDVHQNIEAQNHISAALRSLGTLPSQKRAVVALEGARGGFLYDTYKSFSNRSFATAVADTFLASGEISGPAHAGFTSYPENGKARLDFVGVDDAALYRANVEAYKRSMGVKKQATSDLKALIKNNEADKKKNFSEALASFDRLVASHRTGETLFADYVRALSGHGEQGSLMIDLFLQASDMEKTFNFPRIEAERAAVVHKLVGKLTEADLQSLLDLGLQYQEGNRTFAEYYQELRGLCHKAGVDLSKTPLFNDYIRYVLLVDGINAEKLFGDIANLESAVYARLAATDAERNAIAVSNQLYLAGELVNFALTSHQWAQYQAGRALITLDLSTFETFYRSADARNEAMVKNLLQSKPAGLTALVAGGFHTTGLNELLKKNGISTIVATPKITKVDTVAGSSYLSVFDREKTALEKIFAGKKLFVVNTPAGAARPPLAGTPDATAQMSQMVAAGSAAIGTLTPSDANAHSRLTKGSRITGVEKNGGETVVESVTQSGDRLTTVVTEEGQPITLLSRVINPLRFLWQSAVTASATVENFTIRVYRNRYARAAFAVGLAVVYVGGLLAGWWDTDSDNLLASLPFFATPGDNERDDEEDPTNAVDETERALAAWKVEDVAASRSASVPSKTPDASKGDAAKGIEKRGNDFDNEGIFAVKTSDAGKKQTHPPFDNEGVFAVDEKSPREFKLNPVTGFPEEVKDTSKTNPQVREGFVIPEGQPDNYVVTTVVHYNLKGLLQPGIRKLPDSVIEAVRDYLKKAENEGKLKASIAFDVWGEEIRIILNHNFGLSNVTIHKLAFDAVRMGLGVAEGEGLVSLPNLNGAYLGQRMVITAGERGIVERKGGESWVIATGINVGVGAANIKLMHDFAILGATPLQKLGVSKSPGFRFRVKKVAQMKERKPEEEEFEFELSVDQFERYGKNDPEVKAGKKKDGEMKIGENGMWVLKPGKEGRNESLWLLAFGSQPNEYAITEVYPVDGSALPADEPMATVIYKQVSGPLSPLMNPTIIYRSQSGANAVGAIQNMVFDVNFVPGGENGEYFVATAPISLEDARTHPTHVYLEGRGYPRDIKSLGMGYFAVIGAQVGQGGRLPGRRYFDVVARNPEAIEVYVDEARELGGIMASHGDQQPHLSPQASERRVEHLREEMEHLFYDAPSETDTDPFLEPIQKRMQEEGWTRVSDDKADMGGDLGHQGVPLYLVAVYQATLREAVEHGIYDLIPKGVITDGAGYGLMADLKRLDNDENRGVGDDGHMVILGEQNVYSSLSHQLSFLAFTRAYHYIGVTGLKPYGPGQDFQGAEAKNAKEKPIAYSHYSDKYFEYLREYLPTDFLDQGHVDMIEKAWKDGGEKQLPEPFTGNVTQQGIGSAGYSFNPKEENTFDIVAGDKMGPPAFNLLMQEAIYEAAADHGNRFEGRLVQEIWDLKAFPKGVTPENATPEQLKSIPTKRIFLDVVRDRVLIKKYLADSDRFNVRNVWLKNSKDWDINNPAEYLDRPLLSSSVTRLGILTGGEYVGKDDPLIIGNSELMIYVQDWLSRNPLIVQGDMNGSHWEWAVISKLDHAVATIRSHPILTAVRYTVSDDGKKILGVQDIFADDAYKPIRKKAHEFNKKFDRAQLGQFEPHGANRATVEGSYELAKILRDMNSEGSVFLIKNRKVWDTRDRSWPESPSTSVNAVYDRVLADKSTTNIGMMFFLSVMAAMASIALGDSVDTAYLWWANLVFMVFAILETIVFLIQASDVKRALRADARYYGLARGINGDNGYFELATQSRVWQPDSSSTVMSLHQAGTVRFNRAIVENLPHTTQRWFAWHEYMHKAMPWAPEVVVALTDIVTFIPALFGALPVFSSEEGQQVSEGERDSVDVELDNPNEVVNSDDGDFNKELSEIDAESLPVSELFKTYDVRWFNDRTNVTPALVGAMALGLQELALERAREDFDPNIADAQPLVIVSRDARASSRATEEAAIRALVASGSEVLDLGSMDPNHIAEFYFAVNYYFGRQGDQRPVIGLFFTASHVQGNVGGIKSAFGSKKGVTNLTSAQVAKDWPEATKDIIRDGILESPHRGSVRADSVREPYLQSVLRIGGAYPTDAGENHLRSYYENVVQTGYRLDIANGRTVSKTPLAGLRLLVDTGHAATGLTAPAIYRALGATVETLHEDVQAIGESHIADPSRADLREPAVQRLKDRSNPLNAAVLYDLDGDRGVITVPMPDGTVVPLEGDLVGALALPVLAQAFRKKFAGKEMVVAIDVKSSGALKETLEAAGMKVLEGKTGYPNLLEALDKYVSEDPEKRVGLGFIEKSGHLGTLLTGMKEDPTVTALLVLQAATEFDVAQENHERNVHYAAQPETPEYPASRLRGLPGFIASLPAYVSTTDIRPSVASRLFVEANPAYNPAQGKPDATTFNKGANLALDAVKNLLGSQAFTINVDGQTVEVEPFIVNTLDRLKLGFRTKLGQKFIGWANFRFSANDIGWSIVVDGPESFMIRPLITHILTTLRDNNLVDFDAPAFAGKSDVDQYLAHAAAPGQPGDRSGARPGFIGVETLVTLALVPVLVLGVVLAPDLLSLAGDALQWLQDLLRGNGEAGGALAAALPIIGSLKQARTPVEQAVELEKRLAGMRDEIGVQKSVPAGENPSPILTEAALPDALVDHILEMAPGIESMNGSISSVDLRNAYLRGYARAVVPQSQERRLSHWAAFFTYAQMIQRSAGLDMTKTLKQLDSQNPNGAVIVFHLNQLNDEAVLQDELRDLQTLINTERHREHPMAVVVAVHNATDVLLTTLAPVAKQKFATVNLVTDLMKDEDGVYSYDKLLKASQAGKALAQVDQVLQGVGSQFITFTKIPAQFRASELLSKLWRLLANIGAGWKMIPVNTIIKNSEEASQHA